MEPVASDRFDPLAASLTESAPDPTNTPTALMIELAALDRFAAADLILLLISELTFDLKASVMDGARGA